MTRMWMVDPKILCKNHLVGEHKEIHQLKGIIKKNYKLNGYIKNNCIEILSIKQRHNELVLEMFNRSYNHKTDLTEDYNLSYLDEDIKNYKINKESSLKDLLHRCEKCRQNYEKIYN